MANTYVNITSQTLSSNTASITFSSIPATYTDLAIRASVRGNDAGTIDYFQVTFNSDTATNYSTKRITGTGAVVASSGTTSAANARLFHSTSGSGSVANVFGNTEIYIPQYQANQNKQFFHFGTDEDNSANAYMAITASLWRNTSAITSITIAPVFATVWVTGSTFYLYGIKNS